MTATRAFLILGLIMVALPVGAQAEGVRTVSVVGEGRAGAAPDLATFSVSVTAEDGRAEAAMAEASDRASAVQAAISAAGVAARDVRTGGVSLHPIYAPGPRDGSMPPRVAAYRASISQAVKVRALANLGRVIGAVVAAGGTGLGGISFDVADRAPLTDAARAAAVADAQRAAAVLAKAAGIALGPVVSLRESGAGGPGPVPMMALRAEGGGGVPVMPGEIAVEARIEAVYELVAK